MLNTKKLLTKLIERIAYYEDDAIVIGPVMIQWGSVAADMSGASGSGTFTAPYYKNVPITFPKEFGNIPIVHVTVRGQWTASISAMGGIPSTTGTTARLLSASNTSNARTIMWIAIGLK